jgi:hypothetical protein
MLATAAAALVFHAGPARAEGSAPDQLRAAMDAAFGSGKWRLTGGFRTREREDELRRQGALTVPPGAISHHSLGSPGAPGAYDVVVDGLSPFEAARKLRLAASFRLVLPEAAHGSQGPHLHVEPAAGAGGAPQMRWFVVDPSPREQAITALRALALQGEADAQLRLGQAYAQGGPGAREDLLGAYVWTAAASANPAADREVRDLAGRTLAALTSRMKPDELARARRFAGAPMDGAAPACGASDPDPGSPVLLLPGKAC